MMLSLYSKLFIVVLIPSLTLTSTSNEIKRCLTDKFDIQKENVVVTVRDVMTSQREFCVMELKSPPGTHLILTLNYVPRGEKSINCEREYIHIGNDKERINKNALTSYKFCNKTINEEIVSRGNYLWAVFKVSRRPEIFSIDVFSSSKAECNSSEFRCSPVECVSLHSVCNGIPDCNNSRDEFCHTAPPYGSPCFRCRDGQCIQPKLPRYSLNYGKELWYLCDGYRHCPDGTDERKDICYRIKGRSSAVISCVPSDVTHPEANPVLMWNNVLCNGERDCYHGDDERLEECLKDEKDEFEIDFGAVIFLIVFFIVAVAIGIYIAYIANRKKDPRHGDESTLQGMTSETGLNEAEPHELVPLQCESEAAAFDAVGLRQTTI